LAAIFGEKVKTKLEIENEILALEKKFNEYWIRLDEARKHKFRSIDDNDHYDALRCIQRNTVLKQLTLEWVLEAQPPTT